MKSFRLGEVVRWLCVLPAAVAGEFVVRRLIYFLVQIAEYGGWEIRGGGPLAYWLSTLLFHVSRTFAFVVAGAMMAPKFPAATAYGLSGLAVGLSMMTHVVVQYVAGNKVGLINYAHFSFEMVGAVTAAVFIAGRSNRRR